jgi:hypothetical protein
MPCCDMAAKADVAALGACRFESTRPFARCESQAPVAWALAGTPMITCRWYQTWGAGRRRGSEGGWPRLGRKPRLSHRQLARVDLALRRGPPVHGFATTLCTLPWITELIERRTGLRFGPCLTDPATPELVAPAAGVPGRRARRVAIRRWVQVWWLAGKHPAPAGLVQTRRRMCEYVAQRPGSPSSACQPTPPN